MAAPPPRITTWWPRDAPPPSVAVPDWAIKITQRVPKDRASQTTVLYHRIVTAEEYVARVASFGAPPVRGGALTAASLPGRIAYVYGCLAPGHLHPLRVFDVWVRPLPKRGKGGTPPAAWTWTPWFSVTPLDAPPPAAPRALRSAAPTVRHAGGP